MSVIQPGTPALNLVSSVSDPSRAANTDGTLVTLASGRHGDAIVSEWRGKYGNMAHRGVLYYASTVIAGVALPVNAATLASKFTLWNPAGSGKYLELVEFTMGIDSATEVVNGLALGIQAPVSTGGGSPTSLTAAANIGATLLGQGGTPVGKAYQAATLTNAAVLPVYPLGLNFDATAAGRSGNFVYSFDGKFILPPDTLVTFCSTVAAITAAPVGMVWAELNP